MPCQVRESIFANRVKDILAKLALQYPSFSVSADFWRREVISNADNDYMDEATFKQIRLAEDIPVIYISTLNRWYERDIGIIKEDVNYLLLSESSVFNLSTDDVVIINGESWMITHIASQAGIIKAKIDKLKSWWKHPNREDFVNRQIIAKARIL